MALPQGGGRKPLGAQAPLSPHGSLLLHNREIYKHLLLLYKYKSLYPHWSGFFVFMR